MPIICVIEEQVNVAHHAYGRSAVSKSNDVLDCIRTMADCYGALLLLLLLVVESTRKSKLAPPP